MFSKPQNTSVEPLTPSGANGVEPPEIAPRASASQKKAPSVIASDMKLEGSITGGLELQIDGSITGDVRVERVTVGDAGHVDGGVIAEAVEVRGRVTGSITAKQVRLLGGAHVEGDITHEQLAIENGAYFQGRSLRLQRQPAPAQITPPARREALDHAEQQAAPAA